MRVLAYPADEYGCGHHRVIYPCEALRAQGHDVTVVPARDRRLEMRYRGDELVAVDIPDVDVVVLQRVTDHRLVQLVPFLRARGVAVVIDVDDDLAAIHPANPAWTFLDPNRAEREVKLLVRSGQLRPDRADQALAMLRARYTHSWHNLAAACREASLVTVSTPGLLRRYAVHGRGAVVPNYVPEPYLQVTPTPHAGVVRLGWPASLASHPNDPAAVGNAVARVVAEGAEFVTVGASEGAAAAFGLGGYQVTGVDTPLAGWPAALAELDVGIAPLADTLFNSRKSWLKVLELSALGVPWVASPRAEYARLHREYGAGVLADRPRDWYRALRRLLDDDAWRTELGQAGLAAAARLRLSDHAWEWAEAWQHALDLQRGQPAAPRAS